MTLARRVASVKPSPTLELSSLAKALRAKGEEIVDFSSGEPDFDTPQDIKDAAIAALKEGFTKYTAPSGINELKEAVREKFRKDNNLFYDRDQILISCGAKHSLFNIAQVLFEPGDEVLIPAPYWVSYPDQVRLAGARPVIVTTRPEEGFRLSGQALRRHLTAKTKALILNSPSNPTGCIYDERDLEEIARVLAKKKAYVISDEIYEKIIYDGAVHVSIASLGKTIFHRTLVVNGVSKAYSMTGWRIGYAAGPQEIIHAMATVQSQSTSNPTSIAQKAAVAALRGDQTFTKKMTLEFDRRRRYAVQRLQAMEGISCPMPQGTFYAFPRIAGLFGRRDRGKTLRSSRDVAAYLLTTAKIILVPGDAFGAEGYLRFSYATSMENLKKGLDRMEEAFKNLQKGRT